MRAGLREGLTAPPQHWRRLPLTGTARCGFTTLSTVRVRDSELQSARVCVRPCPTDGLTGSAQTRVSVLH